MDYIFFQMTAVNGFDGISHYLRAGLITNLCQSYSIEHVTGCNANFRQTEIIKPGASAVREARPDARQAAGDAGPLPEALRHELGQAGVRADAVGEDA